MNMKRFSHALAETLASFFKQTDGTVAILYGIMVVPMMILVGVVVDYSMLSSARTALDLAADAGNLAATTTALQRSQSGATDFQTIGQNAGQQAFKNATANINRTTADAPTISLVKTSDTLTATLSYTARYKMNFAKIIGIDTININKTVKSAVKLPQFTDIHIVLDNSGSMGLGASPADQQLMFNTMGCTFACHYTDIYGDTDNIAQARAAGAALRIDVMKQSVANALKTVQNTGATGYVRVALYTLSNSLTPIYALSTDIGSAINAVNNIELAGVNNQGGTNITKGLQSLNGLVGVAGDGSTQTKARGIVMLVTDGVQDSMYFTYDNGISPPYKDIVDPNFSNFSPWQSFPQTAGAPIISGIDPSQCSPIKSKGYTMMTLGIQYVVPTVGNKPDKQLMFDFISQTILPSVNYNMSACASSLNDFYTANLPNEINASIAKMFSSALPGNIKLTQ